MKKIPDRWEKYQPIGKKIDGTRFIAFKVPLREQVSATVGREQRLDDRILLERVPNLGLIIDLTNTKRYYDPQIFLKEGIQYEKIMIPGHEVPSNNLTENFIQIVKKFVNTNKNNDKLIGVHCTHGVNRTGYLICYYMISQMTIEPKEALDKFANARGYKIERTNYIEKLQTLKLANKQNQRERRNRARDANDSHYRDNSSNGCITNKNLRFRSRSPSRNFHRRENSLARYQQTDHTEQRSNNYYTPAARYLDYHCSMSPYPNKLRMDYYNTRPTIYRQRSSYNRLF